MLSAILKMEADDMEITKMVTDFDHPLAEIRVEHQASIVSALLEIRGREPPYHLAGEIWPVSCQFVLWCLSTFSV